MNGRDKCELLNEIRQKIALKNNIEFNIEECTYEEHALNAKGNLNIWKWN